VDATVLLPSVTAAFTVTKKPHKSVRVGGRDDGSRGRLATRGKSGTSPNYNKRTDNQPSTTQHTETQLILHAKQYYLI